MEKQNYINQSSPEVAQRLRRIENRLDELQAVKLNWLDGPDVCKVLHISKRTLDRYRAMGLLPYSKLNGKVFYYLPDIENLLAANRVVRKGDVS